MKLLKRQRAQNDEGTREVKARIDEDMHMNKLAKLGDLKVRTEEQVALAQRLVSMTCPPKGLNIAEHHRRRLWRSVPGAHHAGRTSGPVLQPEAPVQVPQDERGVA